MKKLLIVAVAALFLAIAGNAYAIIPTIDGLITSLDEWDDYFIFGTDLNEDAFTDSWDIKAVYAKNIEDEVSGNGLYLRMDTWDTPTFDGGPGSFLESLFQFYWDLDGDLVPDMLVDLNDALDPFARIVGVYSLSPLTKIGDDDDGTDNALSSIIELYVPDALLPDDVDMWDLGLYARLDGTGDEKDDVLPDTGFLHPVPEPSSMFMLGIGLVGFVGRAVRKKVRA